MSKILRYLVLGVFAGAVSLQTSAQVLVKDLSTNLATTNTWGKSTIDRPVEDRHIVLNGKLIFTAGPSTGFPIPMSEPFITDGTTKGTKILKNINPSFGSDPKYYTEYNGEIYFQANNGTNGVELWKTDGTENGTVLVKDINPGIAGSFPTNFIKFRNELYFLAQGSVNAELWKTDGTSNGTIKVRNNNIPLSYSGKEMAVFKDTLFFIGPSNSIYRMYDPGTTLGCLTIDGNQLIDVKALTIWDTTLVFIGKNSNPSFSRGDEIYTYDPYAGVTKTLCDMNNNVASSYPVDIEALGDKLYVIASPSISIGEELYVIDDDSTNKATLVKDIYVGNGSSPRRLTPLGNKMLFTAVQPFNGNNNPREVWITDGTSNGTIKLTSSNRNTGSADYSCFNDFYVMGDSAFFVCNPTATSQQSQLYVTDGTVMGTHAAFNHSTDIRVTYEQELMLFNNEVYYFADNNRIGNELYVLKDRWLATQDSMLNARCVVWMKADTNLMYSADNSSTITTLINDVSNYSMFSGTSNSTPRTDPSILQQGRNGQPVIQFNTDGKDGYMEMLHNQSMISGKSATVIAIASKASSADTRNTLVGMRSVPGFANSISLAESNNHGSNKLSVGIHDGSNYCGNVGNTNWNTTDLYSVVTASVDANIVYTKMNGIMQDSVSNSCSITDVIRSAYIGGTGFGNEPFEGSIGEVFVFDTVLTRPQRNMLEMYLSLKFKAGADTVATPSIGNSKGIFVLNNTHAAVYFVKNNDADNSGSLSGTIVSGNPGAGAGINGSATSHDGTIITPTSIGTNSYWTISNTGITDFEYDIMLDLSSYNIDSLDKRVIMKRSSPNDKWQPLNTKRFGKYLYAYGLTSFSDFAISSNLPDTVTPPQHVTYSIKNKALEIKPNPAKDKISITLQSGANEVVLVNIQGQVIYSSLVRNTQLSEHVISVGTVQPGIYIIKVSNLDTGERINGKFIKQ